MAKKARKKSAAKRGKASKAKKTKVKATKQAKPAAKKKAKRARKAKRQSIGERISSGYRTVVDTVKGTDRLRNKLEQPGTSESE